MSRIWSVDISKVTPTLKLTGEITKVCIVPPPGLEEGYWVFSDGPDGVLTITRHPPLKKVVPDG